MRTDAIIDKKQVRCPNASTLGYGKWKAQVGDIVLFQEGERRTRVGRMIGRVHYAPTCGETPAIRDYLLLICLGDMLSWTCERWVNPADVLEVQSPRDQEEVLDYFLSDAMLKAPIDEVRETATEGWKTLERYRAHRQKIADDLADFERRHPKGVCTCKLCMLHTATTPQEADSLIQSYLEEK